jgi:hypothetical protein
MNTANLKAYAPKARRDFIAAVSKQAEKYGVTAKAIHPVQTTGDVCVVNGRPFSSKLASRIRKLGELVKRSGFEQTMEQVAYSWFNRIIAIRYMELHNYLGHGRRVLSHPEHPTGFQILEECTDITYGQGGQLPHLSHAKVVELKLDGTKDEELYRELLLAQCHALHQAMPFLFETVDDETELLLPENLTKTDSLLHDLVTEIPELDWANIEIVGWLYQFYISEKKDQVIGKVVKSEDIPAATQLFTPNWIVKYMVQNSLGAQWLATYPDSPLKAQMEYYIEPAEQTDEVNAQLKAITPGNLNPEELTLIDPASGSGHILVEAYELFKAIYLERGYRQRDVPQLILEKNLFGVDIDKRAAQLTGFALMMKGREDDRRLFEREVKLNVIALVDSVEFDAENLANGVKLSGYGLKPEDLSELKELFEHATTFGSLIQVQEGLVLNLSALKKLGKSTSQDLFVSEDLKRMEPLLKQAELLATQYDAVVANPPYMGTKFMNTQVKQFAKDEFPDAKNDLFACFMERGYAFAKSSGYTAMVTMESWMFLAGYESLRAKVLECHTLRNLAHFPYDGKQPTAMGINFGVAVMSAHNCHLDGYLGHYCCSRHFELTNDGTPLEFPTPNERLSVISADRLKKIPSSPIAYWLSTASTELFSGRTVGDMAQVRGGLTCGDTDRFVRRWHEVHRGSIGLGFASSDLAKESTNRWFPFNRGGDFRKWFGNNEYLVEWENGGRNIIATGKAFPRSKEKYFRSSVACSGITSGATSFRYYPEGFVVDVNTRASFAVDHKANLVILGFGNTHVAAHYIAALNPTLAFNAGQLESLPVPGSISFDDVAGMVAKCMLLAELDWDTYECSWGFKTLSFLTASAGPAATLESSYASWITQNRDTVTEMKRLEEENNFLFIEAYGLQEELTPEVLIEQITLTVNPAYRYGIKNTEEERDTRFLEDTMEELISYTIGCMMGRYSLDVPGLIYANSANEGFDLSCYPSFPADDDGIVPLTDTEWYADDATNRVVEFISVAWDALHLEANLDFLATNLSPKKGEGSRDTIRRYLCDSFYKKHMQTYKKRPIYWLFSSGKQKAFQCLVYLHRYNEGTLARMRTEYVIPLTAKLSSHIDKLDNDKLASGSAAEIKKLEKEIIRLQKQQTELTEFDEKLKHLADQRIKLDLDDGVKVNYGKFGDLLAEVKAIHGKNV